MKREWKQILVFTAGTVVLAASLPMVWADRLPLGNFSGAPSSALPVTVSDTGPDFYAGVKAYREGNYKQAERIFSTLHKQVPENAQYTYYLAISNAQLGRFQLAKRYYEEIITLEPNGHAASLAQKGLDYLPKENELDLPPRFAKEQTDSSLSSGNVGRSSQPAADGGSAMADALRQGMQQGMSPQDWMAMQMMMGQNQNGGLNGGMYGGGGMNPMMWMMPGMMRGNAAGNGGYDPSVMSNMMMNQMMQGFGGMGGDSSSGGYP